MRVRLVTRDLLVLHILVVYLFATNLYGFRIFVALFVFYIHYYVQVTLAVFVFGRISTKTLQSHVVPCPR